MSKARWVCLLTLVTGGMLIQGEAQGAPQDPQQKLRVLKKGSVVYVRSYFSADQDVLMAVGTGANGQINFANTRLIPASVPMDESAFTNGFVFHRCSDDATPWSLNGTYIGANHGCSAGREVTVTNHGLTTADLGSEWIDDASNKFYVVKVPGPDTIWMLSENKSTNAIWKFTVTLKGPVLRNTAGNKTLSAGAVTMAQILPACRINSQHYRVNGSSPPEEGHPTACDWFDIEEDYDIIAPDSLLAAIRNKPGKEQNFTDSGLDAVVNNRITYRFLPMGACTVEHRSTAIRSIQLGSMGFIQSAPLVQEGYDRYGYYIPKTRPFEMKGHSFDFKAIQDFSNALPDYVYFDKSKIENTNNPPDRFIQLLSNTGPGSTRPPIGYALGYSLLTGLTQPAERAGNATYAMGINPVTRKSYPYAVMLPLQNAIIPAGTTFHCLAYRQYFNPSAHTSATCVYGHQQGTSYLLYIDYHKDADNDLIRLPSCVSGKKMTVVEQTPSLTVAPGSEVASDRLRVSVTGRYGYAVLRYD